MICTIYSHELPLDKIVGIFREMYEGCTLTGHRDELEAELQMTTPDEGGKLTIVYRERAIPSHFLPEEDDSPLTTNLKGMYRFAESLPAKNEEIRELLLHKIATLNSEFSIALEGDLPGLAELIGMFAEQFDAIVFMQPGLPISRSDSPHFLDSNLELIIDMEGNCEIDSLRVRISTTVFDSQEEPTGKQIERKEKSINLLKSLGIPVNMHLPCVESEEETILRTPEEIAGRVCVLAVTNMLAFSNISGEEARDYLQEYGLWDLVTEDERDFIANPTQEKKWHETWKCEDIWVLMWALKKVPELPFPIETCNLNDIPREEYPIGPGKDPNDFIKFVTEARSTEEILDACDLYYRLHWAATDDRINDRPIQGDYNPDIVYERLYALNWLIQYDDAEWDDVTCDS